MRVLLLKCVQSALGIGVKTLLRLPSTALQIKNPPYSQCWHQWDLTELSGSSNVSSNSVKIWPSGSNPSGPSLAHAQLLWITIPKKYLCPSYSLQILVWWIQSAPVLGLSKLLQDFRRNFFTPNDIPELPAALWLQWQDNALFHHQVISPAW